MPFLASLNFPTFREFEIERAPKFLRFTINGGPSRGKWGAMDGLDDKAKSDDMILAARLVKLGEKKRGGQIVKSAEYKLIDEGPTEETMRSTAKWREWCNAEASRSPS